MTLAAIAVSMPRTSTSTLEEETVFYTSANAVGWPRAYMTYLKTHPDEEVSADAFFAQEAAAQEEAGELARESVVYCCKVRQKTCLQRRHAHTLCIQLTVDCLHCMTQQEESPWRALSAGR